MEGELLRIGPIALYSYGCALAAGFLAGTALSVHEAARRRIDTLLLVDLCVRVISIGVVFGRLGYCLPDIWYYLMHPLDFINVPQGGLSYIPAFLAATAYTYRFAKKNNLHFWSLLDTFAPGLAVGLIIGFLGAVEAQPIEGAWQIGSLYWPPPTLAFFTLEFAGLWYLAASRRRLLPGRRFCQVVVLDATARVLSSIWAWSIYGDLLPHALSVLAGALLLVAGIVVWRRIGQSVAGLPKGAIAQNELSSGAQIMHSPRRKRLPVRMRVMRAGIWLGLYLVSVVLLSRTTGGV